MRDQADPEPDRAPGARLALLLRRWWEEAGSAPGGARPTQQALAARLGIDQTTLSRYLNPKHPLNAPPRVVEALHARLRAPAAELERARALCRAALEESGRQRPAGGRTAAGLAEQPGAVPGTPTAGAPAAPEAGTSTGTAPATAGAPAGAGDAVRAGRYGRRVRPRSRRLLPVLLASAVVLSFAAGIAVHALVAPGRGVPADGVPGALRVSESPYEWPLLRMRKEDQYTRARALQHLLNAYGYKVRTDGFFGAETRDAVMRFQRERHLVSDGKVGRDTWPELVRTVGPGSSGHTVLAVQELLDNVGQGGTVVSGQYTAVTADDLRFFQRTHHLPVTGRADPDTWLALLVRQRPPAGAPAYQRSTGMPPSASG
ncbi:peptidoglycan-binding protein [Streptomyces sp. SudanB182_2057]|uniref:peptidoglycan-binding protein n=1 Tax=Streptomyces sp. SudanB182_2057 TaxID=3035281 RepID=UPI003F57D05F